jgi:hypothetical protein
MVIFFQGSSLAWESIRVSAPTDSLDTTADSLTTRKEVLHLERNP